MAGNKKPRKKYRPPPGPLNPMYVMSKLALQRGAMMDPGQYRDLCISSRLALVAVERGTAIEEDVHLLAINSNMALLLCEHNLSGSRQYLPDVKEAQGHIVSLLKRIDARQSILLTGPGIASVRRLLELQEAQFEDEDCTTGLLTQALGVVLARQTAGQVLYQPAAQAA